MARSRKSRKPAEEPGELQSPGIDDGREERPPVVSEEEVTAPVEPAPGPKAKAKVKAKTGNKLVTGVAARDPNATRSVAGGPQALKVTAANFAAMVKLPLAHRKPFVAWCKANDHKEDRPVADWRTLHSKYLSTPVK